LIIFISIFLGALFTSFGIVFSNDAEPYEKLTC